MCKVDPQNELRRGVLPEPLMGWSSPVPPIQGRWRTEPCHNPCHNPVTAGTAAGGGMIWTDSGAAQQSCSHGSRAWLWSPHVVICSEVPTQWPGITECQNSRGSGALAPAPLSSGTRGGRSGAGAGAPPASRVLQGSWSSWHGWQSSSEEELQVGRGLTLLLCGDFQKCLPQLPRMNHRFFCSCIFLSRRMNQCYPSQVSSCTETWQMCGNYLESCTVHHVDVACTWDRAMEGLWMSPFCSWCPGKLLCVV